MHTQKKTHQVLVENILSKIPNNFYKIVDCLLGEWSHSVLLVPHNSNDLQGHQYTGGIQLEDCNGTGNRVDSRLHVYD